MILREHERCSLDINISGGVWTDLYSWSALKHPRVYKKNIMGKKATLNSQPCLCFMKYNLMTTQPLVKFTDVICHYYLSVSNRAWCHSIWSGWLARGCMMSVSDRMGMPSQRQCMMMKWSMSVRFNGNICFSCWCVSKGLAYVILRKEGEIECFFVF